jgi:hypothetical protein
MSLFRFFARKNFTLALMFCLSTALLFTGCDTDGGGSGGNNNSGGFVDDHKLNSSLIGTWSSVYGDNYVIVANKITYDDGYGDGFAGTIQYISNFTSSAGVIIIKYDADKKPTYYDSFDNYGDPDHIVPPKGDFIGIYYKDLKPGASVSMGGAYIYGGAEEATLDAAKKAFTAGNTGKYMSHYGTYTKK